MVSVSCQRISGQPSAVSWVAVGSPSAISYRLEVCDCLNARRIWSSTPQIADDADDADDADYRMGGGGRRLGGIV